jgi:hypothetical protein
MQFMTVLIGIVINYRRNAVNLIVIVYDRYDPYELLSLRSPNLNRN